MRTAVARAMVSSMAGGDRVLADLGAGQSARDAAGRPTSRARIEVDPGATLVSLLEASWEVLGDGVT